MNKISIIAKNKSTYFVRRCLEECHGEVKVFDPWSDLEFPDSEKYLVRTTGVYGNDLDLLLLQAKSPESIINPMSALRRFRAKSTQYQWFEEKSFPVLPWLLVRGTNPILIEKFFRLYPELIVKPVRGQGGWGVEVLSWKTFRGWKKKRGTDEDYLLQPYIRQGEELRYFFLQGHHPIILKRTSIFGVAANFQKKGTASLGELSGEHSLLLNQVAQASGALYGAIDLIIKDGSVWILELNTVPGIEQLEKVSGRNIMSLILSSLVG
jgi:glutathione synthase/RimK-type ligase-like ATP-grasp enzyme